MNPLLPCYRCTSTDLLPRDRMGLCRKCELEVRAEAHADPVQPKCPGCGVDFFNDWEWIQHVARNRHNYRAWTPDRGKVMGEGYSKRSAT